MAQPAGRPGSAKPHVAASRSHVCESSHARLRGRQGATRGLRSRTEQRFDFLDNFAMAQGLKENRSVEDGVSLESPLNVARRKQHLQPRPEVFRVPGELDAVDAGHDDVRKQQVDMMPVEDMERVDAVRRGKYPKALRQ